MDQLKKLYASLTGTQRLALLAVVIALGIGLPVFTKWQHARNFRPLFSGMAAEDAGAVTQRLKESGIEFRLADNGATVTVASEKVDQARLDLAAAGLPKSGRIGFELFDKTNLSLTDFSEKVNYRRALEGELERSIKAINSIEQARVHVSFPKDSVFLDSREAAKASVLVQLKTGAKLTPSNVIAISNLVASAVEGLSPEAVAVVDMRGNLLSKRRKSSDPADMDDELLDYQRRVEKEMTDKVQATLEPLLGDSRFRVGISADCDLSTSEQTDETYDPSRSVMSSLQKSEDVSSAGTAAGVPGTASNLPRSSIKAPGAGSGSTGSSRRTETTAFETSRSVRQVKTPRGSVKRISAAILLDQELSWQGQGAKRKRVLVPPSSEQIKSIHDVVAGVLGIRADRGDQLVVESLPFEQTRAEEVSANTPPPAPPAAAKQGDGKFKLPTDKRILIGGGVVVVLLIAAAVFFFMRRSRAHKADVEAAAALAAGQGANQISPADVAAVLQSGPGSLPMINNATKIILSEIQEHVANDPVFAAGVVRGWLDEDN